MPRNGSGIYSLPAGNPVTSGTPISSTVQNNTTSDIATALTGSLASDGQTVPTADLPMGGFKHTNAADGSNLTDYATIKQAQNSFGMQLTGVSGSNIITGTATPAPAAYVAGQRFSFVAFSANVGAATLNVSGLGAKAITKNGSTALAANDILTGALIEVEYDGTQFQIINKSGSIPSSTVMAFFQAAAPTGWTQVTTHNNKAIRIVSGAGGGSGGSVAFTTAFASQAVTGSNSATTLAAAQLPPHTHSSTGRDGSTDGTIIANSGASGAAQTVTTGSGDGLLGQSHNHTFTGTAINLAVQYIDMIIASKN